ncbi:MAG: hypothetical protein K5651_07550 [Bacteroidales bacterium]|nr:hypothetical protein [Bacteroidales bacterium]
MKKSVTPRYSHPAIRMIVFCQTGLLCASKGSAKTEEFDEFEPLEGMSH